MLWVFVTIILILVFLTTLSTRREFLPETEKNNNSIGNYMSNLFYMIGKSWHNGETYIHKDKHLAKNDIYLNLPDEYPPPVGVTIPHYNSHENYDGYSAWTVDSDDGKKFWDAMKPHIHEILNNTLVKSGLVMKQTNPIIHFRCSDVPFNRHPWYHLAKWDFYRNAIKGYSEVDVLMCTSHESDSELSVETCKKYTEILKTELKPVKVNIMCGHFIEDFAKMFYAPLVVSPGSSMSFMAGYFGHGKLITTGHFKEGSSDMCKVCEGDQSNVILHGSVPDYHDVNNVNKMLGDNKD